MAGLRHKVPIIDVNNADKMQQDARKPQDLIESDHKVSCRSTIKSQESNSENIDKSGPQSTFNDTVKTNHNI